MSNKLDIIVFGATGYTGQYVLKKVYKLAGNLSWGISGRNEKKLKELRDATAKRVGVNDLNKVPVIIADVGNEESIKAMTARAKVVINCCGPYTEYGEVVVKSCIETNTHYVDITGEDKFVADILQKYGKLAEEKGVYVVNVCGYGGIPIEMGVCYMQDNFKGTVNSIELYRHHYEEGGNTPGAVLNYGTWASAVLFLASIFKTTNKKIPLQTKEPKLKPKLSMKFLHKFEDHWAVPFPTVEDVLVKRSQQFFYEQNNKRPIQMFHYSTVPSLSGLLVNGVFILIALLLAQFKYGRNLLLKYPEFFSNGYCAHLPDVDKMERMRFSIKIRCRGWSDKLPEGQDQYQTPPNKEVIGFMSGANPAYGFSSTAVTLCALMILKETTNLPSKGGVYTPAIAFSRTSLIQQLQNNGVEFKIISVKDI